MGLSTLSNPAVKYRLDKAVDFLKAVMERLLAAKSASQGLHWPGRTIRLANSTCISKPGSKGTDWRVHGVFDLRTGGFSNLELTDGKGAETLTRGAPVGARYASPIGSTAAPRRGTGFSRTAVGRPT